VATPIFSDPFGQNSTKKTFLKAVGKLNTLRQYKSQAQHGVSLRKSRITFATEIEDIKEKFNLVKEEFTEREHGLSDSEIEKRRDKFMLDACTKWAVANLKWVDVEVDCPTCGKPGLQYIEPAILTNEEIASGAPEVDLHRCRHCNAPFRFLRYTDYAKLTYETTLCKTLNRKSRMRGMLEVLLSGQLII
jgi:hypothetical protein